ncbi:Cell division cycle-associated protein 8 [Phytophthora infestans]|uniref:Cell division cycle-associated protein 8 n=1 Tax=Phytophthora infestans TaxID=4787 RepID=A0A833SJI7_PHYIN|nr:Cell division cycle-associated protein 8 [Phytophthora infestans]
MAPSGRRRVGHSLRRSRRRSAANGRVSTRSTAGAGPLQAIGENTVVDLSADDGLDAVATSSRFGLPSTTLASPSPKKLSKKRKKKRPRESTALQSEKKRKQHLERLLDELDTQVQEQCDQLISDAERRAQDLEMELKVQLVYLPEAVRRMPWKTFAEDYGGDLQNVIQSLSQPSPPRAQSSVSRHDIVAATPCSVDDPQESKYRYESASDESDHDTQNRRLSAFTTPMYRRRAGEVPKTVLRAAHKGETFYSVRGSPIIPDSVAKAKAPTTPLVASFETDLESTSNCLRLDNERVVDLSRPEQLSAKSRGEATSKLKDLQAKVAQLLQQLNPCSR